MVWASYSENVFLTTDCYKNPVSFVDKLYSFIHITHQLPFVTVLSLPLWTFKAQIFNFCELRGEKRVYCNIFRKRMRGIKDMGYTFIFNKRRHSHRSTKATDPNIFYLFINAFSKTCIRKYCKKFLFLKSKCRFFASAVPPIIRIFVMTKTWLHIIGIGENGLNGLDKSSTDLLNRASVVFGSPRQLALAEVKSKGNHGLNHLALMKYSVININWLWYWLPEILFGLV